MFGADEIEQLRARIVLLDDPIADVRPVEARHEYARVVERETVNDFVARDRIGSRRQRDARDRREALVQHRQLDVFRTEVVPPLRHAVRLVDREQPDLRAFEQLEKTPRHQPFGRDIQQIDLAFAQRALGRRGLGARQRRVQVCGAHADFAQRGDLILHQRDQRRHDDARTMAGLAAHQRGNLVAQRLAAARRHQHQTVAAARDVLDDLALLAAKGGITEDFVEDFEGARHE